MNQLMKIRDRVSKAKLNDYSESQTKKYLVNGLINYLGYDITDIEEVDDESGKDFCESSLSIYLDNKLTPKLFIMVVPVNINLNIRFKDYFEDLQKSFEKLHSNISILTNGVEYWFFTNSYSSKYLDGIPYEKLSIMRSNDLDIFNTYSKDNLINLDIDKLRVNKLDDFVTSFMDDVYNCNLPFEVMQLILEYYGLNIHAYDDAEFKLALKKKLDNYRNHVDNESANFKNIKELLEENTKVDKDYLANVYIFDKGFVVSGSSDLFKKFVIKLIEEDESNLDKLLNLKDVWNKTLSVNKGSFNMNDKNERRNKTYNKKYNITFTHHSNTPDIMRKIVIIIEKLGLDYDVLKFKFIDISDRTNIGVLRKTSDGNESFTEEK